jgi:uncharacterized RDD family membrane protein YckC
MYCTKCGKPNQSGFAYCYNCGTPLVRPDAPGEQPTPPAPDSIPPASNNFQPPANPAQPTPSYYQPGVRLEIPPQFTPNPNGQPPFKMPVAPNGEPYVVAQNPAGFYSFKNKDNKKVYVEIPPISRRLAAVFIDTLILFLMQTLVSLVYLLGFRQDVIQKALQPGANTTEIQREFVASFPIWLSLGIYTLHLLYCTFMTSGAKGQTLGKKVAGTRVITLSGETPKLDIAFRRNMFGYSYWLGNLFAAYGSFGVMIAYVLIFVVGLGFSRAFWNPQRRGWHDQLADTIVVSKHQLVEGEHF